MTVIARLILVFSFALLLIGFSGASAQEFSCDDLIEISDSSIEVRDALQELGTVNEGDEVDTALGELIDQLQQVAELEGNSVLLEQIDEMADGWDQMNGSALMNGLNGAINSLETLISNDC